MIAVKWFAAGCRHRILTVTLDGVEWVVTVPQQLPRNTFIAGQRLDRTNIAVRLPLDPAEWTSLVLLAGCRHGTIMVDLLDLAADLGAAVRSGSCQERSKHLRSTVT